MHSTLDRQMKRFLGMGINSLPSAWKDFIKAVDATYRHFDEDRQLVDRSIELSSEEFREQQQRLKEENETREKNNSQLKEYEKLIAEQRMTIEKLTAEIRKRT